MDFLQDKESKNLVSLSVYASGDGSLSFVYQYTADLVAGMHKRKGDASDLKVTSRDVDAFIEIRRPELKSWKKLYVGGHFKLYQPVKRVSTDEVQFNGNAFRYVKVNEQLFHVFNEEGDEIKNMNILGAIQFFVNNEQVIDRG